VATFLDSAAGGGAEVVAAVALVAVKSANAGISAWFLTTTTTGYIYHKHI